MHSVLLWLYWRFCFFPVSGLIHFYENWLVIILFWFENLVLVRFFFWFLMGEAGFPPSAFFLMNNWFHVTKSFLWRERGLTLFRILFMILHRDGIKKKFSDFGDSVPIGRRVWRWGGLSPSLFWRVQNFSKSLFGTKMALETPKWLHMTPKRTFPTVLGTLSLTQPLTPPQPPIKTTKRLWSNFFVEEKVLDLLLEPKSKFSGAAQNTYPHQHK